MGQDLPPQPDRPGRARRPRQPRRIPPGERGGQLLPGPGVRPAHPRHRLLPRPLLGVPPSRRGAAGRGRTHRPGRGAGSARRRPAAVPVGTVRAHHCRPGRCGRPDVHLHRAERARRLAPGARPAPGHDRGAPRPGTGHQLPGLRSGRRLAQRVPAAGAQPRAARRSRRRAGRGPGGRPGPLPRRGRRHRPGRLPPGRADPQPVCTLAVRLPRLRVLLLGSVQTGHRHQLRRAVPVPELPAPRPHQRPTADRHGDRGGSSRAGARLR